MLRIKTYTSLMILLASNCFSQSEFQFTYSRLAAPSSFSYSKESQFEKVEKVMSSKEPVRSWALGYTYFITPKHGVEIRTSFSCYELSLRKPGVHILSRTETVSNIGATLFGALFGQFISPTRDVTANYYHVGSELRLWGLSINHHWRPKPNSGKVLFDFRTGLEFTKPTVNRVRVERNGRESGSIVHPSSIQSFNARLGNYYGLVLEPSLIFKMGGNKNIRLGVPIKFMRLEGADIPNKTLIGISTSFLIKS